MFRDRDRNPGTGKPDGFLVCRECQEIKTFPLSVVEDSLSHICRHAGFMPSRFVIETPGRCATCAQTEAGREDILRGPN